MHKPLGRVAVAVLLLGAVALPACNGGDDEEDRPRRTTTTTETTEPERVTTTAPTTTSTTVVALGAAQPVRLSNIESQKVDGAVTVFAYDQPVARSGPQPSAADAPADYVWSAVDAQICAGSYDAAVVSPPPYFSHSEFVLAFADNTRAEASNTGYGNFPKPGFPFGDANLQPNECIRGWITYAVPSSQHPVAVLYLRDGVQRRWPLS